MVKQFSEKTKTFEKEIILQDNMEQAKEEEKNLNTLPVNGKAKSKIYLRYYLERQFSNLFKKASRSKGITGEVLLQLCESRLDNVVFRLGIQTLEEEHVKLVSHRHITVNGDIVNIPSYQLKEGDVVAVREKSKSLEAIENALASNSAVYEWLTWNSDISKEGTFVKAPERIQIPENIKEQLIVELYSK